MAERRLLGLDFGVRRIGVAVSDPTNTIARGLCTCENDSRLLQALGKIIDEFQPEKVIIGLPLSLRGGKGVSALAAEEFAAKVKSQFKLEVVLVDERFSSSTAMATLRDMGVKKKGRERKGVVDMTAAAIILQQYLDRERYAATRA
jgi:putative Holliday junction resolvase